ncbi:cardiolipin synthase [Nocardioides euryhalodurans]|uniref:Cardiolipin synthase n=1 Tax=Nocardioides euryhalodurans TaxID=2518370 RepID=A0A4P7GH87_9ACTN|nr:cardiolipin synthase [Nocardioides euryhalodurans]QBR91250.1 cardiolipin synthase [Nocardioides euryhalodurans]
MDGLTLAALLGALAVALSIAIKVVALGVIPANRKPSTGMAWLLLVLLNTAAGLIGFALFGSPRLDRHRQARQDQAKARIRERTDHVPDHELDPTLPPYVGSVVALNRTLGSMPLVGGNTVELLPDYRGSIAAMTKAVHGAETFVDVEFYITAWDDTTDPLFAALADAAERGVRVRMLFDHLGSRGIPGFQEMLKRLDGTRIEWRAMLPIKPLKGVIRRPDLRNHRKLLVVDGRIGFTGSQNLTEPGYNKPKNHAAGREWVELMARLQGPVVATLEAVFAQDWYTETGETTAVAIVPAPVGESRSGAMHDVTCQLVPSGPGYVAENNLRLFTTLIYSAQRRISLTSPYFVPDESLLYAVTTAAQRGIEVELFVSEESDQFMVGHAQASYYRALLESGVRIRLYPSPWILHSKHFTIDDDVAVLGSSNMDMRSFALNYEISLMMLGRDVVTAMREVEDTYRRLSRELTLEEWSQRPGRTRYVDTVMRLTAGLQ